MASSGGFRHLPARFTRLESDTYVVSNMAGEYLTMSRESLTAYVKGNLDRADPAYDELKAKHLLIGDDLSAAVDLLALKVRTKPAPLANFSAKYRYSRAISPGLEAVV